MLWGRRAGDGPRSAADSAGIAAGLEDWLAGNAVMKRTFRQVAIVSGLVERMTPGRRKTGRQTTFSTDILYDTLRRYDPGHLLLGDARRGDARAGGFRAGRGDAGAVAGGSSMSRPPGRRRSRRRSCSRWGGSRSRAGRARRRCSRRRRPRSARRPGPDGGPGGRARRPAARRPPARRAARRRARPPPAQVCARSGGDGAP